MQSGSPQLIRQYNRDMIKNLIIEEGPITKSLIAKLTNLSVPTVSKIVDDLETSGLICQDAKVEGHVGRKAKSYKINHDALNFIVLFFLHGCFTATLTDYFGQKLAEKDINFEGLTTFEESFEVICNAIDEFLKIRTIEQISAIGLGIPGVVGGNGVISHIPSIPFWHGIKLEKLISKRYNVPVFVENDVKLMTVGLFHKELVDYYENIVLLYISEGLGAGIIINRKLYKGFRNFAGEYGYMQIIGSPVWEKETDFGGLELTLKEYVTKFKKDRTLNEVEKIEYFDLIAVVVANFISVLNPEVIAIRGPAIDKSSIKRIVKKIAKAIPEDCLPEIIPIETDSYGVDGVISFCQANVTSKLSVVDQKGI